MLKIRLARSGTIRKPFYRIVAIDSHKKQGGRPAEILGYWNPKHGLKVNTQKLSLWQSRGAILSAKVAELMKAKL